VGIECILLPIDFSDRGRNAAAAAVGLSQRFGARIVLAHACGAPAATLTPYGSAFPPDVLDEVRTNARRQLDEEAEGLRVQGIEVVTHLSRQTPQEAVPQLVDELRADLVVMGTRGHSGLKHVLVGSVAQHTLREATCPVMTVSDQLPAEPSVRFRHILVPTDFSTAQDGTLAIARELAGTGDEGAEIVIAHSIFVPQEIEAEVEQSGDSMRRALNAPVLGRIEDLVEALGRDGYRARGQILSGRPAEAITTEAREAPVDLIVMGTHGRSGLSHFILGSVAERVVRQAPCPIVTVKPV
jgi:nucleotide-binding universal stress UspA family protein